MGLAGERTAEMLREQLRFAYDPAFRGYDKLMATRIRTILMVSNNYEAFSIARDVNLDFALFGTSRALHLRVVPQITTALSGREALALLERERFDLLLASPNLPDMEADQLAQAAKARRPDLPVAMLVFDGRFSDFAHAGSEPPHVDWVFAWRGDASVILSVVKLAEDRANVDRDIQLASVGTILVIEDSVDRCSTLLPLLYTILIEKTLALTPEGINESDRQARTRVRPKVLLARTFADAERLVAQYRSSLLGVISDLHTLQEDATDPQAGPRFLRSLAADLPIPILVQSSDPDGPEVAASLGARHLDKLGSRMPAELEAFVLEDVGFGSFVFRDGQGNVHARVSSLWEMEQALAKVPDASIAYHSGRDELSRWLRARGEVTLASIIRPLHVGDFPGVAELREYLRSAISIARREKHRGAVADFKSYWFDPSYPFLTIGKGSLGGKGRGLAFMFQLLDRDVDLPGFAGIRVRVPSTLVVTTEEFESFFEANGLDAADFAFVGDEGVRRSMRRAQLSEGLRSQLRAYLARVTGPLAVRSSSLLEDSHFLPCAGLYSTWLLPNNHPDAEVRLEQLCEAIKLVYASVFLSGARLYHQSLGVNTAEEKMAVVLQEVVGRDRNGLFYPTLSGVAQSHNHYPVFDLRPEDGVATVALGLGKLVVEGGQALRFSPAHPRVLPQFSSTAGLLRASQRDFFALDLAKGAQPGLESALVRQPLSRAEQDGVLQHVGSVVSPEDDRVWDGLARRGARVVTFSRQLAGPDEPFCALLRHLLRLGRENFGCHVELEFAADVEPDGGLDFALLQIRPFVAQRERRAVSPGELPRERTVCACAHAMGHGAPAGLRDFVYVHPERFERASSREVVSALAQVNARLSAAGRRYVLAGPGRWGTLDPWLGIPVQWHQISGAKVIVEVPLRDLAGEMSQGTHFFHNLVSAGVAYLSIPSYTDTEYVRWDALEALPGETVAGAVRLVTLPNPWIVRVDGRTRRAGIALP